jgi:PhnB protein
VKSNHENPAEDQAMTGKAKDFVGKDMTAVTPYLYIKDAAKAVGFYEKILGAKTRFKMAGKDGTIMHCEMTINGSPFMLGESNPGMQMPSPRDIGGTAGGICIYVPDVDKTFQEALAAGGKEVRPVGDMFWGDRMGCFLDPFGHSWTVATHTEDLSDVEIQKRSDEWMRKNTG